jgi:hypothetical protein
MPSEFCPRCGAARIGALRFCRSCGYDFDAQPTTQPPDTRSYSERYAGTPYSGPPSAAPSSDKSTDNQAAMFGGIAWIICAALTGYLALVQFRAAGTLSSLGFDSGDLDVIPE